MRTLLVGIGGGSGSGKSTLAQAIADRRPGACIVELDWYYRDLSGLPPEERAQWNFDCPDAFDWPLLLDQLTRLAAGGAVKAPSYDFATHTRGVASRSVGPSNLVVLEGILALHLDEVRGALDLGIYVDAAESVRLVRRLERDVRERGRTPESVLEQFARTVRPMHDRFVAPTRTRADFVVQGEGDFAVAAERALAFLERKAQRRLA